MINIRDMALVVLLAPVSATLAQDKPGMSIVDMLNVPELSSPQLSPDGAAVIYELAEADWEKNKQISHIWRQSVAGGDPGEVPEE